MPIGITDRTPTWRVTKVSSVGRGSALTNLGIQRVCLLSVVFSPRSQRKPVDCSCHFNKNTSFNSLGYSVLLLSSLPHFSLSILQWVKQRPSKCYAVNVWWNTILHFYCRLISCPWGGQTEIGIPWWKKIEGLTNQMRLPSCHCQSVTSQDYTKGSQPTFGLSPIKS